MGRHKNTVEQFYLARDSRGNWNVQWQCPIERKVKRRGCGTKGRVVAEQRMPAIVASILNPAPSAAFTLGELIDAYIEDRTQRPHSPTFRHNFRQVRAYFGGFAPTQINDAACRAYRRFRTSQELANAASPYLEATRTVSDSTALRELNALAGAIIWGQNNRWPGLENIKVSRKDAPDNVRHRHLTRAEVKRLLAELETSPHLQLFVRLALATGARMSALLELKWPDVTFPSGTTEPDEFEMNWGVAAREAHSATELPVATRPRSATLRILGGGAALAPLPPKPDGAMFSLDKPVVINLGRGRGNKRRGTGVIGLSNAKLYWELIASKRRAETISRETGQPVEYVIHYRGRGIKTVDLTGAYERAGITGATQHTLKHTCCSWLVQSGESYERIGKLVGTSAKVIEEVYGHLSPVHLAVAGDVLTV